MSKKKVKIPPNAELYKSRVLYPEKKDPIWVTLENEMRDKAARGIKPYNTKVGDWLKFMKELIYNYYITEKRNYHRMRKMVGPPWYIELSPPQKEVLRKMRLHLRADSFEKKPSRTTKALAILGFTIEFPRETLMTAMELSIGDTGIFFWELYKLHYKMSPNQLRPRYDENARLMMSSLVFADLEECRKELYRVTEKKPAPPPKPPKKQKTYFQPNVKFGEYLQKMYVPCYSNHPEKVPTKGKKPLPIKNKVKLRTAMSYENLMKSEDFMEERKERNRKSTPKERVCNYKFWYAPSSLRNTDPKMVAYILKLSMFKKKTRVTHLKHKPELDNIHYSVKGVSYSMGRPIYHLDGVSTLITGYIPINGGYVVINGELIYNILGYYKYPRDTEDTCKEDCICEPAWERQVKEHLEATRCYCEHNYDWGTKKQETKPKLKYFFPPKKFTPHCFDKARIYQWDEWGGFIRDGVEDALDSNISTSTVSTKTVLPSKLKAKELLQAFLADLSKSPLIIPHLPDAHYLKELQELVRKQVKGNLSQKTQKHLMLKTKRNWLNLDHLDFNARAYLIPFTEKQLDSLNFSHRPRIQRLSNKMLSNFTSRTRKLWLEHTRLLWDTMRYEKYPNKNFLEVFFTYMPMRELDILTFNPYSPARTPKYGAKTCPIRNAHLRWPDYSK